MNLSQHKEKISIIVPVRNEEQDIGLLLDALFKQSYPFDEIVITDGGSSDNTIQIINSYKSRDNRIKLVSVTKASCGEGRNIAIKNSTGSILALIDSGMIPECNWLGRIVRPLLEHDDIEFVFCHIIFDTKSRIKQISDFQKIIVFLTREPEYILNNYIPGSAFRRNFWDRMGGFPENPYSEDIPLLNRLKKMKIKSIRIEDAVVYYYSHSDGYKQVIKKWVTHTRNCVISKVAYHGYYRQLLLRTSSLFFLVGILALTIIDIRVIFLLIVFFSIRFLRKWRLNKELGNELFKRPSNWIRLFLISSTLDLGRTLGALEAFYERLLKQRL